MKWTWEEGVPVFESSTLSQPAQSHQGPFAASRAWVGLKASLLPSLRVLFSTSNSMSKVVLLYPPTERHPHTVLFGKHKEAHQPLLGSSVAPLNSRAGRRYWVPSFSVNSYLQSPSSKNVKFQSLPCQTAMPCNWWGTGNEVGSDSSVMVGPRQRKKTCERGHLDLKTKTQNALFSLKVWVWERSKSVFSNSETQDAPSRTSHFTLLCLYHTYTSKGRG